MRRDPHRREVGNAGPGRVDLREEAVHLDAAVLGRVPPEPPCGLLELPLAADSVAATALVPGDRHVDEALEEIALC